MDSFSEKKKEKSYAVLTRSVDRLLPPVSGLPQVRRGAHTGRAEEPRGPPHPPVGRVRAAPPRARRAPFQDALELPAEPPLHLGDDLREGEALITQTSTVINVR